jgi:hypothetical protein
MTYERARDTSTDCIRLISSLFEELSDYRAFELLRTQAHRADYLFTKQVFGLQNACPYLLVCVCVESLRCTMTNTIVSDTSCLRRDHFESVVERNLSPSVPELFLYVCISLYRLNTD